MSDVISAPEAALAPQSSMTPAEAAKLPTDAQFGNPVEAPKAPEPPKSTKRSLKLKVDGEEFSEEFDPNDNEYMTRQFQLAKMSQKRAHEASELRKQVDAIGQYLEQAKGDPKKMRALMKELGHDERALAASIIEEEIANSQKSPEQLAKEELEEELRTLKDQQKKDKDSWEAREKERLYGQEAERYDMLVSKAIETSDLPKSPYVVRKMADYMLLGLENGVDVHPNDVINLVREEIQNDLQQMFAVMPEEVIEKLIGKDVLGKLRKGRVAKAKAIGAPPAPLKTSIKDIGAKKIESAKVTDKKSYKTFFGV
jgi:hypothetical protein